MKAIFPILILIMIAFLVLALLVLPMEGGTMIPGSVQSTEASTNPYVGTFDTDCEALKSYNLYGDIGVRAGWLTNCLYHHQMQSNGYGLALVAHPDGQETAGMRNAVMYQIRCLKRVFTLLTM